MSRRKETGAQYEAIGARIRELRSSVRQGELAVYLGISQGQLSKVENGTIPPTVDVLLRLSRRFGKSVDWILKGKDG